MQKKSLLLSIIICIAKISAAASLVTGGKIVPQGKYPFFASIDLDLKTIDQNFGNCGGALIAPHWVITAKHCMINYLPNQGFGAKVAVGSVNLAVPDSYQSAKIVDVIYYDTTQNYDGTDIALVKLDHDLTLPPISLTNFQPPVNSSAIVMGKGIYQNHPSYVLREAVIPIDEDTPCFTLSELGYVPGYEFCAGTMTLPRINAALGDSGGPLIQETNGQWYLVGIVSRGSYDWKQAKPSIYSNVCAYRQWILQIITSS